MDTILTLMFPLLVFLAFLFYYSLQCVNCPDCGAPLPKFLSPFKKTRRMWRAGGYLCARCGCETNMAGKKVTADTPSAPFPTLACIFLAGSLLVGIGLGAIVLVTINRPAPVADVPLDALELKAPRSLAELPPEIVPPPLPVFEAPQDNSVLAPAN